MAKRFLRITDEVVLTPIEKPTNQAIKDYVSGTTNTLTVKVAATHSGIVTKNNTFYLPDRMRASAHTWTKDYQKPVLVHHDENRDPIGRVVSAEYVDLSTGMTTRLTNKIGDSIKDRLKKFVDGSMPYAQQVDFVKDVFSDDVNDPNYEGLGYIQLTCQISDPDAIQKIRDGRYFTGSVSATTDKAVCSICKQNWMEEGKCDHQPGELYDGAKAFIMAGDFEYEEWSYVNKPADRKSRTLELVTDGVSDNISVKQSKENKVMSTVKDNEVLPEVTEPVVVPAEAAKTEDSVQVEDFKTSVSDKTIAELEDIFNKTNLDAAEITDEESDVIYELMMRDAEGEVFTLQDAKLSTDKRKKLAGSTFCGPNRSFPVPDCAHVTAARRLIGRYKGNKDGILSCVSRKASALGCGESKDSLQAEEEIKKLEALTAPVTETVVTGEVSAQGTVPVLIKAEVPVGDQMQVIPSKMLTDKDTEIADLKNQLAALRKEFQFLYKDIITMEDRLVASEKSLHEEKTARVLDRKLASGTLQLKDVEVEKAKLVILDAKSLNSQIESVDMSKIIDKINSGLSREPVGSVANPSEAANLKDQETSQPSDETPDTTVLNKIKDTYEFISERSGQLAAEKYLSKMIRDGHIKSKEQLAVKIS